MQESDAHVSVSTAPHVVEIFGRLPPDTIRSVADEVNEMLKYYAYEDALFLAELYYETENRTDDPEALLLYADCLYRANRKEECYGLLRSATLSGARLFYLFARVAFDLNKVDECRGALFQHDSDLLRQEIVDEPRIAAHANLLYAQMLCDENHMDLAFEACQKALDENVLLWTAIITHLRFGGEKLENIFAKHHEKSNTLPVPTPATTATVPSNTPSPVVPSSASTPSADISNGESSSAGSSVSARRMTSGSTTTSANRDSQSSTPANTTPRQNTPVSTTAARPRLNAPRKSTRLTEMASRREGTSTTARSSLFVEPDRPHARATHSSRNRSNIGLNSDTENSNSMSTRTRSSATASGRGTSSAQRTNPVRTSSRIAEASKNAKPSIPRKRNDKQILVSRNSNLARSLSGSTNSVASTGSERPNEDEVALINAAVARAAEAIEEPMDVSNSIYNAEYKRFFDLYRHVASIEESVSNYDWKGADRLFAKLEKEVILNVSMIRLQLGRACFEQAEYRECRLILEALHKKNIWKVAGTEWLSTSLWHLQDTHSLSALTQILTTSSRERPQTWCAAGNCFSLQRQHTQAIECIERALQLDKRFAYAYTLLGHELIVQDELEKAAGSFRSALMLSPRDYRAWYGLGLVHLKKEQNLIALANIQKAVCINPTNRAMLCTLSQIEQQRGQTETALVLIDRALLLNPLDVACRFNRARLLFEAKRNDECLKELDKLKASSPDEAFVFHLLARVHRRMGHTHMSLLNYSWAAELDPRGEQNIADGSSIGGREEYEDDEYGSPV